MSKNRSGEQSGENHGLRPGYYMLTGDAGGGGDGITLLDIWNIFWSQRLLIVAVGSFFAVASIIIALLMTPIYRADSVLAFVEDSDMPDVASRLGGLAGLAGIRMGGSTDGQNAVAILRSREFAAEFISENNMMKLFFEEELDSDASDPDQIPQMYDAVEYFHENVFSVKEDPVSGLVTIAIEWKDPVLSAEWVNNLVDRINSETRARALHEAETNLSYLQAQLQMAPVVELRSAISRIIESELKTIMIANAREQYAFRVIDPAMVPTKRVRPRRALIVITSTFFGGLLALVLALMRHTLRHQRESDLTDSQAAIR